MLIRHQQELLKKGTNNSQKIGKSKGGLSTKIHAVVDALGNPVFFELSEGQESDNNYAIPLMENVEIEGCNILGDKGYDSDKILDYIKSRMGNPVIPPKANRKKQRDCDYHLYKERHLVECFFNKLKNFRHIATRYDKLDFTYAGFVCLACICILIK